MFLLICVIVGVLGVGISNAVPLSLDQESRIIGGVDAPEAYSPHMVALVMDIIHPVPVCGGSIISRRLVLTAAHCIDAVVMDDGQLPPVFYLRVGSNKWNSGGTRVQVKTYYRHPQWDPENIKFDAAVLVTKEKLVLSDTVAVVQLGFDDVGGDEEVVITGWGRTGPRINGTVINLQPTPEDLQLLYTTTLENKLCVQLMKEAAEGRWIPPIINELEICTFHSPGHGMCVGDSGSALMLKKTRKQIGVVSWGWGCAQGAPDIFVRLRGMRPFLMTALALFED